MERHVTAEREFVDAIHFKDLIPEIAVSEETVHLRLDPVGQGLG